MFKKHNKFIVKQMDPSKDLVPVESIADNEHFGLLYLLKKKSKPKTIFHPAPYFQRTGFTLHDVLLPREDGESTESLVQDSSQFNLTKTSTDETDGGLRISFDSARIQLQTAASLSKVIVTKLQKKSISVQSLEKLTKERRINMDHSLIRQLQSTDINLHVVTEILEASEETVYKESTKADAGCMASCYATLYAKVWFFSPYFLKTCTHMFSLPVFLQGNRENNQSIVIPKGCTLAFRTIQLHIRDGAWDVDYDSTEGMRSLNLEDESMGELEEVEYRCQIFTKLSPDLLLIVFNTIKAVMRDKNLLQELSQKMEDIPEQNDGHELRTESPDLKDLFNILQHCSRRRLLQLAGGITYILDALHELMDDQLQLLLESLERKILTQQLELVENLLDQDLDGNMTSFHVDARLLSFPHKEEQILTMELVEMSGVQLQEDGSAVAWDQPFEAVAALFVALYALKLLSGST